MTWTDEQVERIIGTLLRTGVIAAAAVVVIGGVWYLLQYGTALPDYRIFRGEPTELRSVEGVVRGVCSGHVRSLIQLGLLLLIATPIARVAFSAFAFAVQRDRNYVLITLIVLGVLVIGISGIGQ